MHKILTTAFIIALTTCFPIHATTFKDKDTNKIWSNGDVIVSGGTTDGVYAVIKYKKKIFHCNSKKPSSNFYSICFSFDK